MTSWLVRSTPEQAFQVRVLTWDIVLCSCTRHFTLTVPLSTQVYKWVSANLILGVTLRRTSIPSRAGGVEIFLVASCYRNWDKLWPDGPFGSYTDSVILVIGPDVLPLSKRLLRARAVKHLRCI